MENPDPSDIDLVRRCQTGGPGELKAFDELVVRYRSRVYSMIYQMVRNEQDAWDLSQDSFLKAWRFLPRFKGDSAFYNRLYRIATNVTIDWLRKRSTRGEKEFDDQIAVTEADPTSVLLPRSVPEPSQQMADGEIREKINAAMEQLSVEHRTAISLKEIQGLSYQEIADVMECSTGTVMSRLFYARKKLQILLKDTYETI